MRLALLLVLLPGLAAAEDFTTPAPVSDAVIYRQGIALTRYAAFDLPAGAHRILMPVASGGNGTPRVSVAGAALVATGIVTDGAADGRPFFTAEQEAAYVAWRAAEAAAAQAGDARIRAAAAVRAAEDALAFLRSISGGALEQLQPDALGATATAISGGVTAAETARADAADALRAAERAQQDADLVLAQARRDLDATGADPGPVTLLALSVEVGQAGTVEIVTEEFVPDAGWSIAYDLDLGADETVTLTRRATIRQATGLPLSGATLRLSTADPFAQTAPTEPQPDLARVIDPPPPVPPLPEARLQVESFAADALMAVKPVRAVADTDGPIVAYDVPAPVDVPPTGDPATVLLGDVALAARAFNRAAPRTDATAFRMAEVTNTTPEPILAGQATLLREGERVGETFLPLLPAGDETDIAFGPVEHLRLEYRALENETGEAGLILTSGTRRQDLVYRIRNLSDAPETVETLIALPFSEQEALRVDVTAEPAPDLRDVDDRRGVSQWNLVVPPRGEVGIGISVSMRWPEGQLLVWEP